jgi:hypothetical protein
MRNIGHLLSKWDSPSHPGELGADRVVSNKGSRVWPGAGKLVNQMNGELTDDLKAVETGFI